MTAKLAGVTSGGSLPRSRPSARLHDLDDDQQQEHENSGGGERLVLAMTVGVIFVRRLARGAHGDDAHDVRGAVGQRVEAVGDDAERAGRVAKPEFGARDGDVEDENAREDAR